MLESHSGEQLCVRTAHYCHEQARIHQPLLAHAVSRAGSAIADDSVTLDHSSDVPRLAYIAKDGRTMGGDQSVRGDKHDSN